MISITISVDVVAHVVALAAVGEIAQESSSGNILHIPDIIKEFRNSKASK